MSMYYILIDGPDGKKTAIPATVREWSKWSEGADRKLWRTDVDDYTVSTVFLGLDHNFDEHGPPLIYETMVFPKGDWCERYCDRYSTYEEAMNGHQRVCDLLRLGWFATFGD